MAQYRLNAYDADVFIPEFKGLMQYGDQMGGDLRYSPDCLNVETPGGVLQPATKLPMMRIAQKTLGNNDAVTMMYAYVKNVEIGAAIIGTGVHLDYPTGLPEEIVESIASQSDYYLYVFAIGTKLYTAKLKHNIDYYLKYKRNGDLPIAGTLGATALAGTYTNAKWSWCTYETEFEYTAPGEPYGRTNILILSNETDGVFWMYKDEINSMTTPSKFKYIARYAERIWGVGIGSKKDSIFYSRPYSITDWTAAGANEQPEDGGGEIREPTFDEDRFVALVPFADSLIAFTHERAWRISGSDPSNFYIQEQYGNGTNYPETISVMGDRIIMLGDHGLVAYDGQQVSPFMKEHTWELFRNKISSKYRPPVAIRTQSKYILSLSNEIINSGSTGYKFLVYDETDGSIMLEDKPEILDYCSEDDTSAYGALYLPNDTELPNNITLYKGVYVVPLWFDSWNTQCITEQATKWVSPWITLGRKDIQKGGFEMYFSPELNTENTEASVTFKFSIQTEKKTKTKTYVVHALTAEQRAANKGYKQKRLHFGGNGRKFRLIIEVEEGNTVPWRLVGGIHIIAETDQD